MDTTEFFGTEKISKILWKLAPPVMLAQLIQALYNIVDSMFIGRYSDSGLTALSIIYPIQLLMIALAVGTGVGINTVMAAKLGEGKIEKAGEFAGVGTPLAIVLWFLFALICWLIMPAYARMSTSSEAVIRDVVLYGRIVCVFSFGLNWFWLTFPVTELLTSAVGMMFYRQFLAKDYVRTEKPILSYDGEEIALKHSKPGVIITIAREHGSSGKQIGKLVAQKLGIPFYYKKMIALAAHESGLDREFISDIHKNSPDVLRDLYLSSHVVRYAIKAQNQIIRKIADNGSCVIVGRASDHVLKDYDNVVRVFIHAPKEYRIGRVMEVYGDSLKEAKRNIRRSDKARASYYRHISGKRWGDANNYELTVDSSAGIEKTSEIIMQYVNGK